MTAGINIESVLNLDVAKAVGEIKSLETLSVTSILGIDVTAATKQLQSISATPISPLKMGVDTAYFNQAVHSAIAVLEEQLQIKVFLDPQRFSETVNTAINQGFSQAIKGLNRTFTDSVSLWQTGITKGFTEATNLFSSEFRKTGAEVARIGSEFITNAISKTKVQVASPNQGLFGAIGNIAKTVGGAFTNVLGGLASIVGGTLSTLIGGTISNVVGGLTNVITAPIQGVFKGVFEGIGQSAGSDLFEGIKEALDFDFKAFGSDTTNSFLKASVELSDKFSDTFVDALDASTTFKEVPLNFIKQFGTGLEGDLDKLLVLKPAVTKVLNSLFEFNTATILSDFTDLASQIKPVLASLKLPENLSKSALANLEPALKSFKESRLTRRAPPLVAARTAEIVEPLTNESGQVNSELTINKLLADREKSLDKIEKLRAKGKLTIEKEVLFQSELARQDLGKLVSQETEKLIITLGGFAGDVANSSGARIAGYLQRELKPTESAIGLKNPDTNIAPETPDRDKFFELTKSILKSTLRGYSKDAIEIAANALAAKEINPNIKIDIIGESGGGYAAEEAKKILDLLGKGENVRGIGVGTPNFIAGFNPANFEKLLSPDESLGVEATKLYAKYGLADVSAKTQQIPGATQHPYEGYAQLAEVLDFNEGLIEPLSPQASEDLLNQVLQFKDFITQANFQDLDEYYSRITQQLSELRRAIASATDDTKPTLERAEAELLRVKPLVEVAPTDSVNELRLIANQAKALAQEYADKDTPESKTALKTIAQEIKTVSKRISDESVNADDVNKIRLEAYLEQLKESEKIVAEALSSPVGLKYFKDTAAFAYGIINKDIQSDTPESKANLQTAVGQIGDLRGQLAELQQNVGKEFTESIQAVDAQFQSLLKQAEAALRARQEAGGRRQEEVPELELPTLELPEVELPPASCLLPPASLKAEIEGVVNKLQEIPKLVANFDNSYLQDLVSGVDIGLTDLNYLLTQLQINRKEIREQINAKLPQELQFEGRPSNKADITRFIKEAIKEGVIDLPSLDKEGSENLKRLVKDNVKEIEKALAATAANIEQDATEELDSLLESVQRNLAGIENIKTTTRLDQGTNASLDQRVKQLQALQAKLQGLQNLQKVDLKSVGGDVVAGFGQGVDLQEIKRQAEELAIAYKDEIEKEFEISSPSRWAERTMGFVASGFERGQQAVESVLNNTNSVDNFVESVTDKFRQVRETLSNFPDLVNGAFLGLGAIIAANVFDLGNVIDQLSQLKDAVIQDAIAFEQLSNAVKFSVGSSEKAAEALKFVSGEASRLRVNLQGAIEGFVELAASSQGNDKLQAILDTTTSAVLQASSALGLSADQQSRGITALSQIAAKGVVSQEELRGQLSEAIPNANQIAARAFGVTTQELNNLIEAGVESSVFLDKFSRQLDQETFLAASKGAQTLGAALTNVENQAFLARVELGKQFTQGAIIGAEALAKLLEFVADNAQLLTRILQELAIAAGILIVKLALPALPAIISLLQRVAVTLGVINAQTAAVNTSQRSLTPTFDKLGLTVQNLGKSFSFLRSGTGGLFRSLDVALGTFTSGLANAFKNPSLIIDKLKLDLVTLQRFSNKAFTEILFGFRQLVANPGKVFNNLKIDFQNFITGIKNGFITAANATTKFNAAVGNGIKAVGKLAAGLASLLIPILVIDAIFSLFNALTKANKEAKEFAKTMAEIRAEVKLLSNPESAKTVEDVSKQRRQAFADEASFYVKLLDGIGAVTSFGARQDGLTEGLIGLQIIEEQKSLQEAAQSITETRELLARQNSKGNVSAGALQEQAKQLNAAKQELTDTKFLDPTQITESKRFIALLDEQIKAVNGQIDALDGLSQAYGEAGQARLKILSDARNAETASIEGIEKQINDERITVEEGEKAKLEAKLKRIEAEIAANKALLSFLDAEKEAKDREKVEKALNDLAKEGFETRIALREKEIAEVDKFAQKAVSVASEAEQLRVIAIKRAIRDRLITQEQADEQLKAATIARIQAEISAEEDKIRRIKQLDIPTQQKEEQLATARNNRNANVIELIDLQIEKTKELEEATTQAIERELAGQKRVIDGQNRKIDGYIQSIDALEKFRDKARELEQIRFDFSQKLLDSENSLGDLRVGQLRRALEIREELTNEESKNLSAADRAALEKELAEIGVDGRKTEAEIVAEIIRIEKDGAARRLEAIEKEFEFKRRMLKFEEYSLSLASQRAELEFKKQIREGRLAKLEAKSAKKAAGREFEAADKSTPEKLAQAEAVYDNAIAAANEQLEIAELQIETSQESLEAEIKFRDLQNDINTEKEKQLEVEKGVAIATEQVNTQRTLAGLEAEYIQAGKDRIAEIKKSRDKKLDKFPWFYDSTTEEGKKIKEGIELINKEAEESIQIERDRIKAGRLIGTPGNIAPIIPQAPLPTGQLGPSNFLAPQPPSYAGDLKEIFRQLGDVTKQLMGTNKPTVTQNLTVNAPPDNTDFIRKVKNSVQDSVLQGLQKANFF